MPRKVSLEELLKESDIVALSITASEDNRGFMDKKKFDTMKKGTIFLNPARDWLMNTGDFYDALENRLAGAWVDFSMPFAENLVTTPHLGGFPNRAKTELIIAKKLLKLKTALHDFTKSNRGTK